ncbi:MAG: cobalamin-dependent protein [Bacillota bacterium]
MANAADLISLIANLKEDETVALVKGKLAAGENPLYIVSQCQQGMRMVGERYKEGQYFIAGLIMAGEILRQVMELMEPFLTDSQDENCQHSGTMILGTVKEDIHDLGKNIVKMLLTCNGISIYDLGVDVPPEKFVEEAARIQPDIVGLSGLISASYESMKETIALLRRESEKWDKTPHIIIGGGQIDEKISQLVGTDYWVSEADTGVKVCRKLLLEKGA